MIRKEILEEERKKQLRRQVKKELIDSGKILQREKRTPIPQDIQDRVWIRDSGKCVMCGSNESLEFDHIIPFSKGGANTYRNIQLLCEKCNREKSNKIG
ncbi:MAG: HNH endonuclease [Candidatus Symbiothrix sp.]|nr:HNH endonuclease [Candidatus Symbiothrix sp.]